MRDAAIWPDGDKISSYCEKVKGVDGPCKAGDVAVGASVKASRSRRTEDDCFSAELNREFYPELRKIRPVASCGRYVKKSLTIWRKPEMRAQDLVVVCTFE